MGLNQLGLFLILIATGFTLVAWVRQLERRVEALESRLGGATASDPPCRLTLRDPGGDPAAVEAVLVRVLEITPPTAHALVGLRSTEIPIGRLTPLQAEELRKELSSAGAFVSLFIKPPPSMEPRETGM